VFELALGFIQPDPFSIHFSIHFSNVTYNLRRFVDNRVFYRQHRKARVLFAISDVALVALAFLAAYQIRLLLPFDRSFALSVQTCALVLGAAALAWLFAAYWQELYDRLDAAHPLVIVRDAFRQCAFGGVVIVLVEYFLRLDLSRPFLLLFVTLSFVILSLFRFTAGSVVGAIRREYSTPYYVVIVGLGERALKLARVIEASSAYAIHLKGFLETNPGRAEVQLEGAYPVWELQALTGLLQRQVIDEVIFAVDSARLVELEEIFLACDEQGVRTRVALDFFPHVHSQVYLDRLQDVPLLTFSATPHDEIRLLAKRVIDVALSGAALLALLPLLLLIAAMIRLTSPGPAIFRQQRLGLSGRPFTVFKFRSMGTDAEARQAELAHLNMKSTAFKIPNDPRVTPLGRWLRKFSLDELPQLWNVLRGDMSIVGPRPAVPQEVERYESWQRRRLRLRPGRTCLWAVNGRDALDFESWMRLDMEYIDSWSLALDWQIMLRTIPQVLLGKGAH
jgi:exopolysaccharide biosynthesis polyprenyl glycosylphosphotransferase